MKGYSLSEPMYKWAVTMSWMLVGIAGVIAVALLIIIFAPKSRSREGSRYREPDEVPLAASRVAEETLHASRSGAIQGRGLMDDLGPFTGTLPRRKEKEK